MSILRFDALDRQAKVTEPDGAITLYEYDSGGNLAATTDALGNKTKREHDLAGQLTKLTDPLGNETTFTYTSLGQITSVTNPNGDKTMYSYYPGGKVQSVVVPGGESQHHEYDRNGNTIAVTDALGARTQIKYDQLDRAVETIDPIGYSKKFSYDALGNITGITDEKGNLTQYKYSALGDVIEVIDANGHSTKYGYDAARRLTKLEQIRLLDATLADLTQLELQVTAYKHNKKGEVVEVTSPLGSVVKFAYDGVGNLTSKLDEDGLETLYEYNLASKLTKVSYADGKTVELGYNALKQLTEMRDWLGTTKIDVDPLGRATKTVDAQGNEVGYEWNSLGQKESLTYPDGSRVSYEYDASGRMTNVVSPQGQTSYKYDRMGRLSERILPDSTSTKYEVNPMGRLASLTHLRGSEILDSFRYSYDPTGNITAIEKQRADMTGDSGLFSYGYDALGRLTSVRSPENEKSYAYDSLGNRIHSIQNGVETRYDYNARNQLIRTSAPEVETSYSYDERGNLRKIIENGEVKSRFTFDATNMMTGAFSATNGTAEYTYNGFCSRVAKLEGLTKQNFVLDMTLPYDNLLSIDGEKKQNFVWGNGLISGFGNENFNYLNDHLGSPIRVTGSDFEEVLAYDEFGKSHNNSRQPFSFTGYMTDRVSGMHYAQARYYDPRTSRMISQDPHWGSHNMIFGDKKQTAPNAGFVPYQLGILQSKNLYAFCVNNPVTRVDPVYT